MRAFIKLAYVLAIIVECLVLYKMAIVPLIPIINTVIADGVSLQVAINSVKINGMHLTSIAALIIRTSVILAIWSVCVAATSALYRALRKISL